MIDQNTPLPDLDEEPQYAIIGYNKEYLDDDEPQDDWLIQYCDSLDQAEQNYEGQIEDNPSIRIVKMESKWKQHWPMEDKS